MNLPNPSKLDLPGETPIDKIRNFCIIAHIDHGKSTLADRMLQITGLVNEREMRSQYLDRMELERERGITIKSQAVRMGWEFNNENFILNMIDTPGHVDFSYEVSRSLIACEGAILLVDAAQGVQAQTLANLYLAMENDLTIIPVLNKIDLPAADVETYGGELANLLGIDKSEILTVSGKTGQGVQELMNKIVQTIPSPIISKNNDTLSTAKTNQNKNLPENTNKDTNKSVSLTDSPRALIFDSEYDIYRGVVTFVRVFNGKFTKRDTIKVLSTGATHELLDIGVMSPEFESSNGLKAGEVGYFITGVKDVSQTKVGDTLTTEKNLATQPLSGFQEPKPMVYAGLFPQSGDQYALLRESIEKLKLNDASLVFEPETSDALGFGFRCGFLGLLHLEIVRERLEREFDLDIISTTPSVVYTLELDGNKQKTVTNPSEFPDGKILGVHEPVAAVTVLTPSEYIGTIMDLTVSRRGSLKHMEYLSPNRVEIHYSVPLMELIFDFFDHLKSRTKGYASLDYELDGTQLSELVRVDILLQGEKVDAFSMIVHTDKAYTYGSAVVKKLKDVIPRQQFEVPIQAAIGGKIIARETVRALRKDVLAKCYGGDITRKRKLLEKQKEGKKRMKTIGKVSVPNEAFIAILSQD